MSRIEVNIHKVNDLIPSFSKVATKISNTTDDIASISSRLDDRVKSRRGIDRRLHQITAELESMERKMQKLVTFLQDSMNEYSNAEEQITKQVNQYVEKIGVGKKSKEKGFFEKILDGVQVGLDVVGLIPVVGEIADGVNGSIYLARGDNLNAALSFAAMIPVVGSAATGAKYVNKGIKYGEEIADAGKTIKKDTSVDTKPKVDADIPKSEITQKSPTNAKNQLKQDTVDAADIITPIIEKKSSKDIDNVNHPIRTYRNADLKKLEEKYTADPRITVEMPYVGKGKAGTNSEGWLRDKDLYWKEIMNKYPESLSEANKQKIQFGFSPINDKTFREHCPQYDIKELYNDKLIHHHVGGGGQAVAVPSKLHPGTGGIHNAEKAAGVWGNDSEYAELLEKFLNK